MNEYPQNGDYVTIHYTGMYENGVPFDSTRLKGPFRFRIGARQIMRGIEEKVKKMKKGEKKRFLLRPDEAYGAYNPKLVQPVPRDVVEKKASIFIGNEIALQIPYTPKQYIARIIHFDQKTVTLDLNPPMAGKNVIFEVELLSIERNGKEI